MSGCEPSQSQTAPNHVLTPFKHTLALYSLTYSWPRNTVSLDWVQDVKFTDATFSALKWRQEYKHVSFNKINKSHITA